MLKDENNGLSLIEMICTLVVMAVITIAAFLGFSSLYFKYRLVQMTDLVTSLASNIQMKYMDYPSYNGLSISRVKELKLLPAGVEHNDDQTLQHYLNGRLDVFAVHNRKGGMDNEFFAIRTQNLSADFCTELASLKWDNNLSSGLLAMEIVAKPENNPQENIKNFYNYCEGIDADLFAASDNGYTLACMGGIRQGLPINPRYAWKACNCSENTCMITWVYK